MRTFTFLMAAAAIIPCAYAEGSDESGWYAGLSYERLQETDSPYEYQALGLTGGYDFNRYFGAEVTAATGVDGDGTFSPSSTIELNGNTVTLPSYRMSADLSHRIDLMGVGHLPVTDRIRLVGKAGVSHYKYDITQETGSSPDFGAGRTNSSSPSGYGFAGSLGAEVSLTESTSLTGGYNYYAEQGTSDGDVDGFQIGLKHRF
ncbi:porin family protein [Hyphomonas sp. GM-8P]|uniref:porin family protein n=1 Tax=Hyphomonas sp. GM-8P TaxID=1280945 RepID=UPI000DD44AF0|nr:porin family protein [Hyphomonas sp. GM-8P]